MKRLAVDTEKLETGAKAVLDKSEIDYPAHHALSIPRAFVSSAHETLEVYLYNSKLFPYFL